MINGEQLEAHLKISDRALDMLISRNKELRKERDSLSLTIKDYSLLYNDLLEKYASLEKKDE